MQINYQRNSIKEIHQRNSCSSCIEPPVWQNMLTDCIVPTWNTCLSGVVCKTLSHSSGSGAQFKTLLSTCWFSFPVCGFSSSSVLQHVRLLYLVSGLIPAEEGDFCGHWKYTDVASFGAVKVEDFQPVEEHLHRLWENGIRQNLCDIFLTFWNTHLIDFRRCLYLWKTLSQSRVC